MNYKIYEKDNEVYFRYTPAKENFNKNKTKINFKDSPFTKLKELNLK